MTFLEFMKPQLVLVLSLLCLNASLGAAPAGSPETGVLILAHGHKEDWNRQIEELTVHLPFPTAVAFGMAHKNAIAEGVAVLEAKGVRRIVVVPLYVSSFSPIIRASAYLLGLRQQAPPELEMFNTMSHGLQDPHAGHGDSGPTDLSPLRSRIPIHMTSALDDHPLVARILLDRAQSISKNPASETVILVAHGPNGDSDNRLCLEKMAGLADFVRDQGGFLKVEAVTMRDDARSEVRQRAVADLRSRVEAASRPGTALVVPVLLSRGGIETRLEQCLQGLRYRMPSQFLLPDPRIAEWIKEQVDTAARGQIVYQPPQSGKSH